MNWNKQLNKNITRMSNKVQLNNVKRHWAGVDKVGVDAAGVDI